MTGRLGPSIRIEQKRELAWVLWTTGERSRPSPHVSALQSRVRPRATSEIKDETLRSGGRVAIAANWEASACPWTRDARYFSMSRGRHDAP
jgi:hypothetical protein